MYSFHKYDQIKNRSLYMYSKYYGKKFIKEFLYSRNIKYRNNLIKHRVKLNKNINTLSSLLKSFEREKKILSKNREISLNDYISVSKFVSMRIIKDFDIILFNSLLKLNDQILFKLHRTKIKLNDDIYLIFKNEKKILQKFAKLIKIDDKIKF